GRESVRFKPAPEDEALSWDGGLAAPAFLAPEPDGCDPRWEFAEESDTRLFTIELLFRGRYVAFTVNVG
ncbi:MAG TPA: hypothetical protein VK465_14270, partial [Fibrobacteria bacterium]|nr:hypothetical protein [Fibrobacteria bacterium]